MGNVTWLCVSRQASCWCSLALTWRKWYNELQSQIIVTWIIECSVTISSLPGIRLIAASMGAQTESIFSAHFSVNISGSVEWRCEGVWIPTWCDDHMDMIIYSPYWDLWPVVGLVFISLGRNEWAAIKGVYDLNEVFQNTANLCVYMRTTWGTGHFEKSRGGRLDKIWIWPVWGILTVPGAVWDVFKAFLTEMLEATGGVLAVRKLPGFPRQLENRPSLLGQVQSLLTHCQYQTLKLGSSAAADNLHSASSVFLYLDRHVRGTIASTDSFAWLRPRTLHFSTCSRPVLSESGQHHGHSGTLYWWVWPSTM